MRSIVPVELTNQSEEQTSANASDHSVVPPACDISVFNMSSVSQRLSPMQQDNDLTYLLQLLPEVKRFDEKTKSLFKLQTLILVHNIKYNDQFKM